ncbi:hypothetical protein BamIOP4010DRAFT_3354 [Burkholderia ambifaria IOP40-10]|uniref:Uncharacterized protein n=1 Tax=Burkholderia ambifaria IOP40-10 TaxID=396596 RepID=B1FH44_9BURK|nr:hypothetical protein BamIOP4010DRAFT_3354 [Burkholderia ambifaria IOP40-10]
MQLASMRSTALPISPNSRSGCSFRSQRSSRHDDVRGSRPAFWTAQSFIDTHEPFSGMRSTIDALPKRARRSEVKCPRGHLHSDLNDRATESSTQTGGCGSSRKHKQRSQRHGQAQEQSDEQSGMSASRQRSIRSGGALSARDRIRLHCAGLHPGSNSVDAHHSIGAQIDAMLRANRATDQAFQRLNECSAAASRQNRCRKPALSRHCVGPPASTAVAPTTAVAAPSPFEPLACA